MLICGDLNPFAESGVSSLAHTSRKLNQYDEDETIIPLKSVCFVTVM